MFMNN